MLDHNELALAPLGAGDLIDRAVRMYRRHFLTLIRIAAPPVLVSALGSTFFTIAVRAISTTSSNARVALYVLILIGGMGVTVAGSLFSLIVMGGATRNLVSHLIWNEPVSFRSTYRGVKARFWGLLGASIIVAMWLAFAAMLGIMIYLILSMIVFAAVAFTATIPWITAIGFGIGTVIAITGALILFFLLAGRMAYVPQAMLVEGRGVLSAIGRSFSLASGNVKRLMAMTLFTLLRHTRH